MTGQAHRAEGQVEQAANAWMEAAARRDVDSLDRILAAEFRMVTSRGSEIDRDQWLHSMLHRVGAGFTAPAFLDVRVRVYGEAAVMTSRTLLRATFDGKDVPQSSVDSSPRSRPGPAEHHKGRPRTHLRGPGWLAWRMRLTAAGPDGVPARVLAGDERSAVSSRPIRQGPPRRNRQ